MQYSSHREMATNERIGIERYLLDNVTIKENDAGGTSSTLQYIGIDEALIAKLQRLPSKHRTRFIEKERRVENAVEELIDRSLSNYYFEQIGNALVEIRRLSPESLLRGGFEEKLTELVEAYNLHTEKEVSVDEIVPAELREYMTGKKTNPSPTKRRSVQ